MTRIRMLDDMLGQPDSLSGTLAHHTGPGAPTLATCASLLRQCTGRILITGMGASFFAATPAAQLLETHGHRVHLAEASELLHFGAGSWQPGDIAILISRSGGSVETLELAARLAASHVPILAITNIPGSAITGAARHTLEIASEPDELIAVQTYTGTVLTLLLLAAHTADPALASILAHDVRTHIPTLRQHIDHCLSHSDTWESLLTPSTPLYLLGRGSALATLGEGALLFHETAKATAVAMSSGQFRHGPVEVVSPAFRALIVGSPAPTRHLDAQLANDLRAMRADIRWIGPAPATPAADTLVPWPADLPPTLNPIFDIIPLQVAAYRTALWRGIRPGDFRYASEITGTETGFPLFEASLT